MVKRIARLALVAALGVHAVSYAQQYPEKPVRIVVPFGAGGVVDVVVRILAPTLGESLNQRIVVDNRVGSAGNIGSALVAKAPPDGYTLLLGVSSPLAANVSIYGSKMPYNPAQDFAPISMITRVPQVLSVHPSVPARDLKQLIALAKADPKKLNYGSAGSGTTGHLVAELFKTAAGIEITHVPYRISSLTANAVLAGEVDMMVSGPSAITPHLSSGRIRAIAISSAKRSPILPDVPTIAESGLPGFDVTSWYCLVAPAGTPRPIIDKIHAAVVQAIDTPQIRQQLVNQGTIPETSTPEELGAFIRSEIVKWGKAVKLTGAKVD